MARHGPFHYAGGMWAITSCWKRSRGTGVGYRARQMSLGRLVAVKMVLDGEFAGEDQRRRFRAEAEAAANLDHPNIVPVYETGVHEDQPYFSMKFIAGRNLSAAIPE